jgi:Na+/H+ antiporter NhaC
MSVHLLPGSVEQIIASPIFVSTFASVLSGAVFGDHCSPLSDTTILSSTASGSDHIDHVRTQLPYALTVGVIALISGYLVIGLGGNWIAAFILGVILMAGTLFLFGRKIKS